MVLAAWLEGEGPVDDCPVCPVSKSETDSAAVFAPWQKTLTVLSDCGVAAASIELLDLDGLLKFRFSDFGGSVMLTLPPNTRLERSCGLLLRLVEDVPDPTPPILEVFLDGLNKLFHFGSGFESGLN